MYPHVPYHFHCEIHATCEMHYILYYLFSKGETCRLHFEVQNVSSGLGCNMHTACLDNPPCEAHFTLAHQIKMREIYWKRFLE